MGNCFSFCLKKQETDQQDSHNSNIMAKDVVYETTPFDGQKPGTSGIPFELELVCLITRIKKESQSVYAKKLY